MEGCRFCDHLKKKSKGDQGQRFEIRASLSGAERSGHAWTDDPVNALRIMKAFDIWPAMKDVEVFDRDAHEFYTTEEMEAEYGQAS